MKIIYVKLIYDAESKVILGGQVAGYKDAVQRVNVIAVCIYGFFMTFVVYGVIMDTATVFMYTEKPTLEAFLATYLSGIIFNAIHGLSTVVFLAMLLEPFVKKIKRIKYKYGMFKAYKKS